MAGDVAARPGAVLAWQQERGRLLGIAYRMLGDFGEAEDVVSEVAAQAVLAERADADVRSWAAWLTTTCVRRSIDRMRTLAAARTDYPGTWLPEPVATDRLPEDVVATRELLSLALLHVAERLRPAERAALVLHRAFAMTAPEIGEILGRSPAAVRQLVSRGEAKLDVRPDEPVSTRADPRALAALVAAIESGDVPAVLAFLEDDAVLWADGGGIVSSALNPILGADRVARFLVGIVDKSHRAGEALTYTVADVNGDIAIDMRRASRRDLVTVELSPTGRIRAIRQISNPAKLTRA